MHGPLVKKNKDDLSILEKLLNLPKIFCLSLNWEFFFKGSGDCDGNHRGHLIGLLLWENGWAYCLPHSMCWKNACFPSSYATLELAKLQESFLVFDIVLRMDLAETGSGKQTTRPFIQCSDSVAPKNWRAHLLVTLAFFLKQAKSKNNLCCFKTKVWNVLWCSLCFDSEKVFSPSPQKMICKTMIIPNFLGPCSEFSYFVVLLDSCPSVFLIKIIHWMFQCCINPQKSAFHTCKWYKESSLSVPREYSNCPYTG